MNKTTERPQITYDSRHIIQEVERFMHASLRPILKQQNPHLNQLAISICLTVDEFFFEKPLTEKQRFMHAQLEKNTTLKNQLIGIVIGNFSAEEMQFYLQNAKSLNKRISQMIQVRILDQMNFFLLDQM